jgi:hypothetical protein
MKNNETISNTCSSMKRGWREEISSKKDRIEKRVATIFHLHSSLIERKRVYNERRKSKLLLYHFQC